VRRSCHTRMVEPALPAECRRPFIDMRRITLCGLVVVATLFLTEIRLSRSDPQPSEARRHTTLICRQESGLEGLDDGREHSAVSEWRDDDPDARPFVVIEQPERGGDLDLVQLRVQPDRREAGRAAVSR
jgi:hypothetical protein